MRNCGTSLTAPFVPIPSGSRRLARAAQVPPAGSASSNGSAPKFPEFSVGPLEKKEIFDFMVLQAAGPPTAIGTEGWVSRVSAEVTFGRGDLSVRHLGL